MTDFLRKNKSFIKILLELDDEYFAEYVVADEAGFVSAIATWIYDSDGDFDEDTWQLLQEVRQICGDRIAWKVIEALCKRDHDT